MSKFKKIMATLGIVCMFGGALAFTTACGGSEKTVITVVCKDEAGNPISGVDVEIRYGAKIVSQEGLETNEKGEAKYTLNKGETEKNYQIYVSDFPVNIYPEDSYWKGEVKKNTQVEFVAEDWTPDGSERKPFMYVGGDAGEMEVTIPANATYYFQANKLNGRYLYVKNENVEIDFENNTYTYNTEGNEIKVPVGEGVDANSPNTVKTFAVKNKTNEEITLTLELKTPIGDLGTASNPLALELDKALSQTVTVSESGTKTTVVYYTWTATEGGELTISSNTSEKYIAITVDGKTDYLQKEEPSYVVNVTAGQRVTVSVSAYIDGDAPLADREYSIVFTATFAKAEA